MISKETKELEKTLKIFANEQRLTILKLLKGGEEKSVGEIADHLEIDFKSTSRQLLLLADRGILRRRHDGAFVLYAIAPNLSKSVSLIAAML